MTATDARPSIEKLSVDAIRVLSIDAVQKANQGHPGAPMGLAPVAYALYARLMKHNPRNPAWIDRDRFILSNGHASMLLYASLFLAGYPITLEDIENFRVLGSVTAGHPEKWDVPGIEATTGPLGQGISMAVGLALAERWLAANFNTAEHQVVDHHTWVIASDGDIQEGISSEASSLAGHWGLGKLIVFFDDNKVQLASKTDLVFSEDVTARYEAYGWQVLEVGHSADPHADLDVDEIERAARQALAEPDRPTLIRVHSHLGYGSPNKQDTSAAHGSPLGEDEVRLVKEFLGWDPDKHFYVPPEVLEHWSHQTVERGAAAQDDWEERFSAYAKTDPARAAQLRRIVSHQGLPEGWDAEVPTFSPADKAIATRAASGKTIQWAAAAIPELVGGSADLASSNNTDIDGGGDVLKGEYGNRNVHYGVREHAMGAITNGLVLHGLRAFGGTFLTFSDYMRGAVRLSALMKLPSIWVWTHDSIGLGSDGPTHQPVEHVAALRAMPNLSVVRPADANETALAWKFALGHQDRPTALALSRQNLPILDPARIPADAIESGAYVLQDPEDGAAPELILIGTGSEVSLCLEAAALLGADGIKVRVVSAPCLDTFAEADPGYQESVLPTKVGARVAVEAGVQFGWERWMGSFGSFVGMHSFGASGSAEAVYEHFGITAERVARVGRDAVARAAAADL
ncbi:MAG TPA: transketolase [Solirubrobacteraceae bacterium]|nr:transketolase [Solirubrobacteraceae bacterium]